MFRSKPILPLLRFGPGPGLPKVKKLIILPSELPICLSQKHGTMVSRNLSVSTDMTVFVNNWMHHIIRSLVSAITPSAAACVRNGHCTGTSDRGWNLEQRLILIKGRRTQAGTSNRGDLEQRSEPRTEGTSDRVRNFEQRLPCYLSQKQQEPRTEVGPRTKRAFWTFVHLLWVALLCK